jgi:KUP system potassium uptake protein
VPIAQSGPPVGGGARERGAAGGGGLALNPTAMAEPSSGPSTGTRAGIAALTLGALGVVFGDIGTSPLYALQTVFAADDHAVAARAPEVYGVLSLVFWTITMIVSVKYVTFIMRADNGGEGGIMALTALVQSLKFKRARAKLVLIALGILGASLFYGDGMITPAISVLSAVEGLQVAEPSLESLVVPIAVGVLAVLFGIQRFGTGVVGQLFGPVMVVWFLTIGTIGVIEVAHHPEVLKALSPTYGADFFLDHPGIAFFALGSIVLAVTGAEALYADMGHFGRSPIRRAWFFLVFPALTLNYLAQGSLILRSPAAVRNPFYLLLPHWAQIPMVLLATVATVIASQAVISGAFSVTRQAVQLSFLPWMRILHTSAREERQVYVPAVNWGLFAAVTALVVGFGSSASLAGAYGVAVTGTFVLNTLLFLTVARLGWGVRRRWIALAAVVFLGVELTFLASTATKVLHGGWLPLGIGLAIFVAMTTWRRGYAIVTANREDREGTLHDFIAHMRRLDPPPARVPGTAVFLNANSRTTPLALRANVKHNHVLHETVVTMSIHTERVPHVAPEESIAVEAGGDATFAITRLTARFGYQDRPDVPGTLRLAVAEGLLDCDLGTSTTSYFVSRISIERGDAPSMAAWRKRLFLVMARNAASPVEYFRLPTGRTVTMGEQIEI